jgi:hypothetical protein
MRSTACPSGDEPQKELMTVRNGKDATSDGYSHGENTSSFGECDARPGDTTRTAAIHRCGISVVMSPTPPHLLYRRRLNDRVPGMMQGT